MASWLLAYTAIYQEAGTGFQELPARGSPVLNYQLILHLVVSAFPPLPFL